MFAIAATGLLGINAVNPDLVNVAAGVALLDAVADLEATTAASPPVPGAASAYPVAAPVPARAIVFENVGFRYPGTEHWVLRGLHLTVPVGRSTAVVGVNGAGKTTLVKLLCGLYRPTEGRILVDGVDIGDLDPRAWQRTFAALFQDWVHWALPARDNVRLGAPDHGEDDAALHEVAHRCGLTEVVEQLPDGWSTVLSREFGGVDLSGGQWQRVGLARALWGLRGGASVLVLDEPTSALDVRGEAGFYDTLLAAAEGRTVVLISHRFSTVRHADQIAVLDGGRVAELGDHATLTAAGGLYARLFDAQANAFVEGAAR
jgi:ABC-type multidrug transport system fused ATPase/permease subunit